MKLDAVLWDYDGTLVNSVPKNIEITKTILSIVAPHLTGEFLPKYLHNEASYHEANHGAKNWQELYVDYYGLTHEEMLIAGGMWAEHQEKNTTEVSLFKGIKEVITEFSHLPHGICSQNSQNNIRRLLENNAIAEPFKSIIGYDDVSNGKQKPDAAGGIKCIDSIFGHRNSQPGSKVSPARGRKSRQTLRQSPQSSSGQTYLISIGTGNKLMDCGWFSCSIEGSQCARHDDMTLSI